MYQHVEKPCGSLLNVMKSDWATRPGAGCILFLPGYHTDFETAAILKHLMTLGENAGVTVISVEYRGHGQSPGNRDEHDLHDFLDDARFALNHLYKPEMGPLTFVGHSIGGWFAKTLALEMAEKNLGHTIAGVASIAPTHSLTGPNGYVTQLLEDPSNQADLENHGYIWSPLGKPNMIYTARFMRSADELDLVFRKVAAEVGGDVSWQPLPQHPPLPFPVTLIHGAHDEACMVEDLHAFKDRFAGSDIDIITRGEEPNPNDPTRTWKAKHGMARPGDLRTITDIVDGFMNRRRQPFVGQMATPALQANAG